MAETWRWLDTGHLTAAENMTLDQVLLESVGRGESPDTVRLLQFRPDAVLTGFHQDVSLEVRESFCRDSGIDINRRITGGGAIFFQECHLGWEIICRADRFKGQRLSDRLFRHLSQPMIKVLNDLGVPAVFRPRNDIEVHGRKISGTGGTGDRDAFLFQGTLLVDLDIERMLKSLRIPVEKLKDKEIDSVRQRITTLRREIDGNPDLPTMRTALKTAFETVMDINLEEGSLTAGETAMFHKQLPVFQSDKWIYRVKMSREKRQVARSVYKAPGGLIRTALVIDHRNHLIQSIMISGDFFAYPRNIVNDLEAVLKDCRATPEAVTEVVDSFFASRENTIPGVTPADFTEAVCEALTRVDLTKFGFTMDECNHIFPVNGTFESIIQQEISVLLLPYCAKDTACRLRYEPDCTLCGGCRTGEAYTAGFDRKLKVISITSFEDLMENLDAMAKDGVVGYIGCCCEPFYTKHREDFEKSGLPGILIDVENVTCYDLDQARDAYAGEFQGKTELNLQLLDKVLNAAV